jgi:hypothetical protein
MTDYTLSVGAGGFSLGGQAVALRRGYTLAAGAGSFTLSGQAVGLRRAYMLSAGAGSFVLSGQAVALRWHRRLAAGAGAFTLSGQAATLRRVHILRVGAGSFSLSGKVVWLHAVSELEYLAWLAADGVQRVVLVEAKYYADGSEQTRYFSNYPYISGPADTPANRAYDDILADIPSFRVGIDAPLAIGDIEIYNESGDLDGWLDDAWDGREVAVYLGDPSWSRNSFRQILSGIIADISAPSPDRLSLSIRDKKELLNVPVQSNLFTEDPHQDTPKPLCLGWCFNVTPFLVDAASLTYQIHDGEVYDIYQVRDNGVPVGYTKDLIHGKFTLGNSVASVSVTQGGSGYAYDPPQVVITAEYGSGAAAVANVVDGVIDSVTVTAGGFSYIVGATAQIVGGGGSGAILEVVVAGNSSIAAILVTNGGSGYAYTPPAVSFSGGGGSGAAGYATIVDGAVASIEMTDGGTGYTSAPTVTISGGNGSGATAVALLSGAPAGKITCDVYGAKGGPAWPYSPYYLKTAADLIQYLSTRSVLGEDDLNLPSFAALNAATVASNSNNLAVYLSDRRNMVEVFDELMASVGGYWYFDRLGRLTLWRLDAPTGTAVAEFDADDVLALGLRVVRRELPLKKIRLGSSKNWTVQDRASLAGAVSETMREAYATEWWDILTAENAGIATIHKGALEPDLIPTLLHQSISTEAARRAALHNTIRTVYEVELFAGPFQVELGDEIKLTHPRFGFENGAHAIVIGIDEKPTRNRVTLELWR